MSSLRTGRRAMACLVVLAILMGGSAVPARADDVAVLNLIPADAPLAVVIPNAAKLSQKIAMLNEAAGLGVPQMADALGAIKQELGIKEWLKDDGALIMVVMSVENLGQGSDDPTVILMPVTDYAAYIKSRDGDPTQPVAAITVNGQGQFAKKIDGYAVMGHKKELVEAYKPGNAAAAIQAAAGKLGNRCMDTSDAFLYVNMPLVAATLQPKLQEAMAHADAAIADMPDAMGNKEMVQVMLKIYGDAANAILRDSAGAVVGVDINELGVGYAGAVQFKPGSAMAGLFGNAGEAGAELSRLPDQPYIFAASMNFQGIAIKTLVDNALAYFPNKDQGGDFLAAVRKIIPLMALAKTTAAVYYVPPAGGGLGTSLLNGATVTEVTDAQAYVQGLKDYITSLNNVKFNMGAAAPAPPADGAAPAAEPNAITYTTKYTAKALQVEGVDVDQYDIQFQFPQAMMQQMGPMAQILPLIGGTGQSGYVAVSGNRVVSTTTLNAPLLRQVLASIKEEKGLGASKLVGQVRSNLTPKSAMEVYISLGGIMATVNNYMVALGQAAMFQAPADLPPVAIGASVQENGLAARMFVPIPVIKFVKDTVSPFLGGGPGAPPPPQPGARPAPAPF